jgi:hypothetical protein
MGMRIWLTDRFPGGFFYHFFDGAFFNHRLLIARTPIEGPVEPHHTYQAVWDQCRLSFRNPRLDRESELIPRPPFAVRLARES